MLLLCIFFFNQTRKKNSSRCIRKEYSLFSAHERRNVIKGDLPFPWKPWFTVAPDRSLNKTTAWLGIKTKEQQHRPGSMSAGGLKTISESPVDSLRDSDQFSIKVEF